MNTVSVIIPTLNAGAGFAEVLQRLKRQKVAASIEIVVMDSSSTDDTVMLARRAGARVEVIARRDFNHGETRNRAIALSAGQIVVMLSQDALPADDFLLARLCDNFADAQVAGVYARQQARPEHGPVVREHVRRWCGGEVRRESSVGEGVAYGRMAAGERVEFCRFDNVCSAIRRAVWELQRFAARDFAEDMEWSKRVLEGGWKIVYDPEALVIHSHALSLRRQYGRAWQTHRSLRQIFGWRVIPHRRELWGFWRREVVDQMGVIRRARMGRWGKMWAYLSVPARGFCTVMAVYRGGRAGAEARPEKAENEGHSTGAYESHVKAALPVRTPSWLR